MFNEKKFQQFLEEDLGPALRDVSVESLGERANKLAQANVMVKTAGVICGLWLIEEIVSLVENHFERKIVFSNSLRAPKTQITLLNHDGDFIDAGTIVATLQGAIGVLLMAERTILNLLQRLSGISTLTKQYVDRLKNKECRILDTRKTTPGLRWLEKEAVRIGGAENHRFGLYDMVMLKDNHLKAMGGDISLAVKLARQRVGPTLKIEVETTSLEEVKKAVGAGSDLIMLDNMSCEQMKECVEWVQGKVPLEASGGITLETIDTIAATGVNFISVGALTHSAKALDISMKIALALTYDEGR